MNLISQRIYNGAKLLIIGIIFGLLLSYVGEAFSYWGGGFSYISSASFFGLLGFLTGFIFNK